MTKKKKAVYAGSFDPITDFDYSILKRCAPIFDEIIVLLLENEKCFFLPGERLQFLQEVASSFDNMRVDCFHGLVGQYCRQQKIPVCIRAVQDHQEQDREIQLAQLNHRLFPGTETFFMVPDTEHICTSSSLVLELAGQGSDISAYLPSPSCASTLASFREHLAYQQYLGEVL